MELNYNILVACNSNQKIVLINEFPEIKYQELEGMNSVTPLKAGLQFSI